MFLEDGQDVLEQLKIALGLTNVAPVNLLALPLNPVGRPRSGGLDVPPISSSGCRYLEGVDDENHS